MPLTVDQFVRRLVEAELFARRELNEFIDKLDPPPTDGEKLAKELVHREKLTKYQAQVAYAGDGKSLVLGNYVIVDKIGAGGMGEVYLARHRRMGRKAALKILPAKVTDNPDAVRRFHREVQAVAKLSHPNIVGAFDAGESKGTHYCVMEYVEGRDLTSTVKQDGTLSEDLAVDCMIQAATGLEYAHAEKVIHRDIKPANLLLDVNGTVKVLDLGLARFEQDGQDSLQTELTQTGTVMGTVDYMAPEQALNTKHADARSDIYSLGCTLFYLLVGRSVFTGETVIERILAHRDQPIPSLQQFRPNVSPAVNAVFQKMVAKNPQDRFQSMGAVLAALQASRVAEPATATENTTAGTDIELRRFLTGIDEPATATYVEPVSPADAPTEQLAVETQNIPALGNTFSLGLTKRPKKTLRDYLSDRRVQLWGGLGLALFLGIVLIAVFSGRERDDKNPEPAINPAVAGSNTPHPAVAPFDEKQAEAHQAAWAKHLGVPAEYTNRIGMKFRLIPPGEFMMGSPAAENRIVKQMVADSGEGWEGPFVGSEMPQHKVRITKPFYFGVYEVTNAEFRQMGSSGPNANRIPATNMSYDQMLAFCKKMGKLDNASYRLPTEAEWEYACRAGTTTPFSFGDSASSNQANFNGDFPYGGAPKGPNRSRAVEVGTFRPNPFGLFDMHGNVWEMCSDWYSAHYYKESPLENPTGPALGTSHVERGGDYEDSRGFACRSALRHAWKPPYPSVGFRIVCEIPLDEGRLPPVLNRKKRPPSIPRAADYALSFDGKDDYVQLPHILLKESDPITVEVTVRLSSMGNIQSALSLYGREVTSSIHVSKAGRWSFAHVSGENRTVKTATGSIVAVNDTIHLAGVWDGSQVRLFVNGKTATAQGAYRIPEMPRDMSIGSSFDPESPTRHKFFHGIIDEVRISKSARYTQDYTPVKRFTPDKDTLALYHFDEGSGDVLTDASGNNHHGKIHGATWVNVPAK